MKVHVLLGVLLLSLLISCEKDDLIGRNIDYELQCIWDRAPHCAFTSLIEYNGKYYCCFREAESHVPIDRTTYGKIRVLESIDGMNWYSIDLIEDQDYDLRDPNLEVTTDNRLMLVCGSSTFDVNNQFSFRHSRCYFYDTELTRSEHYVIVINNDGDENYWLWKVVRHNDEFYSVAYCDSGAMMLLKSSDGINFYDVTPFEILGSEADLVVVNNQMWAVCRSIESAKNGYIGYSSHPFNEWHWEELDHLVESPELINIGTNILLAGRGVRGTTIYTLRNNNIIPVMILPSDGDAGYPGMIYDRFSQKIWMSYYNSPSTTQIFMANFFAKDLL